MIRFARFDASAKRGRLSGEPPAILESLRINADAWLRTMTIAGMTTGHTFGEADAMDAVASRQGKRWLKGKAAAQRLFRRSA